MEIDTSRCWEISKDPETEDSASEELQLRRRTCGVAKGVLTCGVSLGVLLLSSAIYTTERTSRLSLVAVGCASVAFGILGCAAFSHNAYRNAFAKVKGEPS